jgi:Ca2+-binding EF-hand superfamily protein
MALINQTNEDYMKTELKALAVAAICFAAIPASANEKYFDKMDTNSDGVISASEHEAAAREKFQKADTNSDGSLSKEEFKNKMKKHKKD